MKRILAAGLLLALAAMPANKAAAQNALGGAIVGGIIGGAIGHNTGAAVPAR